MDKDNLNALLSFFNLIAAELSLEDCRSIKDMHNLMPIIANYIKTGILTFVSNKNFGFREAVEMVEHELDEPFYSQLDALAAEKGNEFEITKIFIGLLYTFRLLQKDEFASLCAKLSNEHDCRIAEMIEYLDDRQRWTFAPWPSMLRSGFDEDKENSSNGPASPISCKGTRYFEHCSASKTFTTAHSPSNILRRQTSTSFWRMIDFDGSPVAKVVNSPRGEEVVRIHALEKEVKSLREIRDTFGQEKDRIEELCQAKEDEIQRLKEDNLSLTNRLARYVPKAERVEILEEQVHAQNETISDLTKRLVESNSRCGSLESRNAAITFERNEALQNLDIKQNELEQLQQEREKVTKRANDELEMHEQSRKKLLEVELHHSRMFTEHKAKVRELEETLEEQRREIASHIEQKEREAADQYQMMNQIKENSEDVMEKAEKRVKGLEEELRKVNMELRLAKASLDELYELNDQRIKQIAALNNACDEYKRDREEASAEMERLDSAHKREYEALKTRCVGLLRGDLPLIDINLTEKRGLDGSTCAEEAAGSFLTPSWSTEQRTTLVDQLVPSGKPLHNGTFRLHNELEPVLLLSIPIGLQQKTTDTSTDSFNIAAVPRNEFQQSTPARM